MKNQGNPEFTKYSINMLLSFIRKRKDDIRRQRKWYSHRTFRYRTPEIRTIKCAKVRDLIAMIRVVREEIDWRKENNLFKISEVKEYWAGKED